jgi:hypothetical protein
MKKFSLFFTVLALVFSSEVISQISQSCDGFITIGTTPSTSLAGLHIYGNQSHAGEKNFRVTFPQGWGLANTELAGLASLSDIGGVWTALYAKRGSASYAAYLEGTCYVNGTIFNTSDSRLKENIKPLLNSLSQISKINGVKYDYLADPSNELSETKDFNDSIRKNNYGFIAQDVLKIVPELVIIDPASGNYAINYDGFIPMLVEALKEQQIIIESLQSDIQALINDSGSSQLKSSSTTGTSTTNALYQNAPNPFTQTTTIRYSLNEQVQKASINIYDMNGAQIKSIPLNLSVSGDITINGSELKAGIYIYTLITDGVMIDTKQMILTN